MKSLVSFWAVLATELARLCCTDASRDIVTLSRRCEAEGVSFLEITLPDFSKDFLQALEGGQITSDLFTGFRRKGGLPTFLSGFLRRVFTPDGALLQEPDVNAISAVRQLTCFFAKVEGRCTPQRETAAVTDYCSADDACTDWDLAPNGHLLDDLRRVSQLAFGEALKEADNLVASNSLVPRHGPGSTADGLRGNAKYDVEYWPDHLESTFPWVEWGVANYRYGSERSASSLEPLRAKLRLVPKSKRSPRVIVIEPTSLQYMQQALLGALVGCLERRTFLVGFTDQEENRSMARMGSLKGALATLDLSEASDRVSYLQAAAVCGIAPSLWEGLDATRSFEVDLPGGLTRPLGKFASMGSAVCFPVEAMVFASGILLAIENHHRKLDPRFRLTPHFVQSMKGKVRVYGDDIVVPVDYISEIYDLFSLLGWKINDRKSFYRNGFRESCGGEYWRGDDITPIRVTTLLPTGLRQVKQVQATVALRNRLYLAGYWSTCQFLDEWIVRVLKGNFPILGEESPGLGRISVSFLPGWVDADKYQRPLHRAYAPTYITPRSESSDYGKLLKCLISPGSESEEHLVRSGRPVEAYIKLRWIPVAETPGRWLLAGY